MQAAWALVLAHHLRSEEVSFGFLRNGRSGSLEGIEDVVGSTLNILPARVRVLPQQTVRAWLESILEQSVESSRYEYVSVDMICGWTGIAEARLIASYVVYQNNDVESLRHLSSPTFFVSKMGLPLRIDVFPQQPLALHMSYHRHELADATVAGLLGGLAAILENIGAGTQQTVGELLQVLDRQSAGGAIQTFCEGGFHITDVPFYPH